MAKMAILAILAKFIGIINMAILGTQLEGIQKYKLRGIRFISMGCSLQTLSTVL